MDILRDCVFIDESCFDINMIPPTACSIRDTPSIITMPTRKAVSHTILGAISAMGVINIEMRIPQTPKNVEVDGARKRRATAPKTQHHEVLLLVIA
jgi:hypothetical protein